MIAKNSVALIKLKDIPIAFQDRLFFIPFHRIFEEKIFFQHKEFPLALRIWTCTLHELIKERNINTILKSIEYETTDKSAIM